VDGMNVNQTDLSEAVRSTAMLADVTISLWGAERTDAGLMESIKTNAGAVGNVGKVVKNLLAGADGPLKDTRAAFQAVRSAHYQLTLPWTSDPHAERQRGPRLLSTMLWEKYTTVVAGKRREAFQALERFLSEYPALVERARANLGGLAEADYPTVDQVKAQFRCTIDFEPIPAGTSFKGLPDGMLDKLGTALQRKQERMIQSATVAMWTEARARVEHIAARLGDPEHKFKSTTVESVRELIEILPAWNVCGSPHVEEAANDIARMLGGVDSKTLRDDMNVRKDVAEQAQGVIDKLNSWGV
jgi:hypothetical protein